MASAPIRTEIAGGVARLTLARPERHNAIDDAAIAALADALDWAAADAAVRVVVLAGEGRSFCAGADIGWMRRAATYDEAENLADARALARLLHLLDTLPKPTVCLAHGAVYGGGNGLVAAADIAVAAPDARFRFSEVRLGITPATISPYVIAAVGARHARRLFLTAETFDAAEATRIGLVHLVAEEGGLAAAGEALIGHLLENGPAAMAAAKVLVRSVSGRPVDAALREETTRAIAEIRAGEEAREGLAAFLEKRAPRWRGA